MMEEVEDGSFLASSTVYLRGKVISCRRHGKCLKFVDFMADEGYEQKCQIIIRDDLLTQQCFIEKDIWYKFIDLDSEWEFIGHLGKSFSGCQSIYATSIKLLQIRRDPASVQRAFQQHVSSSISLEKLSSLLFGEESSDFLNMTRQWLTEIDHSKLNLKPCLAIRRISRYLRTNEYKRNRCRPPRPPHFAIITMLNEFRNPFPVVCCDSQNDDFQSMYDLILPNVVEEEEEESKCHDGHRHEYLIKKKLPQLVIMIQTITSLIASDEFTVIDVGCGLGDLMISLASLFLSRIKIICLDVNERTLSVAESRAKAKNFHNVQFILTDLNQFMCSDMSRSLSGQVIMIGLHACGGLTDCILQHANANGFNFCVNSCCFMSHPFLRHWTRDDEAKFLEIGHVAETEKSEYQQIAQEFLSSWRLRSLGFEERKWQLGINKYNTTHSTRCFILQGKVML